MIDTILFDFDGTVADTLPIIFKAFQGVFHELEGREVTDEEILEMFGPTEMQILEEQFGQGVPDISLVYDRFYQLYADGHQGVQFPREFAEFLTTVATQGVNLGIVTGKGRRSLEISLEKLGVSELFDILISGDDVKRPKPHPEGLLTAIKVLRTTPEKTLFVGDSDADVLAGKAAGVVTIGVKWFDPTYEFGASPDYTFQGFSQFRQFASRLIGAEGP